MGMKIVNYEGLYGENEQCISNNFIHLETLETRSQQHDWLIRRHVHINLFQIFYIKTGNGNISVNNIEYELLSPCIISIPANNVHGFTFDKDTTGFVLTLSEVFFQKIVTQNIHLNSKLDNVQMIPLPDVEMLKTMTLCFENLVQELYANRPLKELKVELNIGLMLIELYRLLLTTNADYDNKNKHLRSLRLFNIFQKNIKKYNNPQQSLNTYSQEMGITQIHLNRICKTIANKTAMEVVHEHFIGQAQNYLRHTSYSISEIAYQLNFNDPAYFSRLFKKVSQYTPSEFREKQ
jgi:AraC family transcriptional regulator, transcriptional activator of pobA